MPWVRFTDDFDFSPAAKGGRVTTAFKAGMIRFVTRECAALAKAAGKATQARRPAMEKVDGRPDG